MRDFNLNNKDIIPSDLISISDNLTVVHFDEFPILYYGTNTHNNKILGSHLDEDDDAQKIYCLHTILTNKQFADFSNQKKSYRTLLEESKSIGLVEKDYNNNILKVHAISFKDIPADYLPLENSFCPISRTTPSLKFSLSLKGKLADLNKAGARVVSEIQEGFNDFVDGRMKALKELQLSNQTLLIPASTGSFKINFEISISRKPQQQLKLFAFDAPIDQFLSNYLQYLTTDFNDDVQFFLGEKESSENFSKLVTSYETLFKVSASKAPEDLQGSLKEDVIKALPSLEKITDQIGNSFDGLEFLNVESNHETTLGYIDMAFANQFRANIDQIEILKNEVITDDDYKDYEIYIYHLNTDTRSGNAWIKDLDDATIMTKPKIKIDGEGVLEETKYTESLYASKWIPVKAKAKKVNDKYTYLNIQFDK